jgi:hypothetical protein
MYDISHLIRLLWESKLITCLRFDVQFWGMLAGVDVSNTLMDDDQKQDMGIEGSRPAGGQVVDAEKESEDDEGTENEDGTSL